jgi:hypothetical protein
MAAKSTSDQLSSAMLGWIDTKFNGDIQRLFSYYQTDVRPRFIQNYQVAYGDMTYRKSLIDTSWQSNISAGITRKIVRTFQSHIYDNVISFHVGAASDDEEKVRQAKIVQEYLVWNYSVSKSKQTISEVLNDSVICGEGYGKIIYTKVDKKIKYIKDINGTPTVQTTSQSYKRNGIEYYSPFSVLVDPGAKSWDDARYVVVRKLIAKNDLVAKYPFLSKNIKAALSNTAFMENLTNNRQQFSSKDWDYEKQSIINKSKVIFDWTVQNARWVELSQSTVNGSYSFDQNNLYEVIEYRSKDSDDGKLRIIVDGHTFYNGINPLPIKEFPIFCVYFNKQSGTVRGMGIPDDTIDYEIAGNALLNLYMDDLKLKSNPVWWRKAGVSELSESISSYANTLEFKPGQILNLEDKDQLFALDFWASNIQVVDMLSFFESAAFMTAWVNEIIMGSPLGSSKVPRVAGDVANRVQGFKVRMLPLFESLSDAMAKIGEFWIVYTKQYFNEVISMDIFDDKEKQFRWNKLDPSQIEGQYRVIFDVQAMQSAYQEIRIAQLLKFIEVAWPAAIDPATGLPTLSFTEVIKTAAQILGVDSEFVLTEAEALKKMERAEKGKANVAIKVQAQVAKAQAKEQEKMQKEQAAVGALDEAQNAILAAANQEQIPAGWEEQVPVAVEEMSGALVEEATAPLF